MSALGHKQTFAPQKPPTDQPSFCSIYAIILARESSQSPDGFPCYWSRRVAPMGGFVMWITLFSVALFIAAILSVSAIIISQAPPEL